MLKKKSKETGILLIKIDITHFTLLKLESLANSLIWYGTVYPEIDWRWASAQKSVVVINIFQMICMGHVLEALGAYQ